MNAEVREPREMWRKFVRGDFDADEPPRKIREWLEATDYNWRDGEWPPYIVHPSTDVEDVSGSVAEESGR
jgi:hypothetical protein